MPRPFPHDARGRYKLATNIALEWIKCAPDEDGFTLIPDHSRSPTQSRDPSRSSSPLYDQIVAKAEQLVDRNVEPTRKIQLAFESALKHRREVTGWYIDDEMARNGHISFKTKEHIHFTGLLARAFKILLPDAAGQFALSSSSALYADQERLAVSYGSDQQSEWFDRVRARL